MSYKELFSVLEQEVSNYSVPVIDLIKIHDNNPFKILVATVLSARTKDKVTEKASRELFKKAKNFYELKNMSVKELEKLIYPVGFYKTKAKNLKKLAEKIIVEFNGKIPKERSDLVSLSGVGRKTANLVLAVAFDRDVICVDTHVHRISNRLGLVRTKTTLETELALMKIIPKRYWKKINFLFVAYGQNLCKPINPNCKECKIRKYCVFGK